MFVKRSERVVVSKMMMLSCDNGGPDDNEFREEYFCKKQNGQTIEVCVCLMTMKNNDRLRTSIN